MVRKRQRNDEPGAVNYHTHGVSTGESSGLSGQTGNSHVDWQWTTSLRCSDTTEGCRAANAIDGDATLDVESTMVYGVATGFSAYSHSENVWSSNGASSSSLDSNTYAGAGNAGAYGGAAGPTGAHGAGFPKGAGMGGVRD